MTSRFAAGSRPGSGGGSFISPGLAQALGGPRLPVGDSSGFGRSSNTRVVAGSAATDRFARNTFSSPSIVVSPASPPLTRRYVPSSPVVVTSTPSYSVWSRPVAIGLPVGIFVLLALIAIIVLTVLL
jgi:hypothetical protein